MASIYLKHPVHGAKVATAEAEAAYDESKGWVRFDPNEAAAPEAAPAPVVNVMAAIITADAPEPDAPAVRRRRARQE